MCRFIEGLGGGDGSNADSITLGLHGKDEPEHADAPEEEYVEVDGVKYPLSKANDFSKVQQLGRMTRARD